MSNNRWRFFNHSSKPKLDGQKVAKFKRILQQNLKVGVEVELNLPEQKGSCKGANNACPCIEMPNNVCWTECSVGEDCIEAPSMEHCINKADNCEEEDCVACSLYDALCHGLFCPGFISKCVTCEEFKLGCDVCDRKYNVEKDPENIRERIIQELKPNHSYGQLNDTGVHSVTTDGSLLGKKGVEVVTIGRRVAYWEFYNMAKRVLDCCCSKGAYTNERCSIHMHLLCSYYGNLMGDGSNGDGVPTVVNELEEPLPQIVLANFHQLTRKYQNAMTWMFMGLDNPKAMTRWEKFRISVLPYSAVRYNMKNLRDKIGENSGKFKYGFINYAYTNFNRDGDVSKLHVEMRALDGVITPSAIAAIACMHYAMMIKAVEISRYGLIEVGDDEWLDQANRIKETILNGNGGYDGSRFGDTRHVQKYADVLREEATELVRQLKHILIQVGPAYEILESLADTPIALRRISGLGWDEIEEEFKVDHSEESILENRIHEAIDIRETIGHETVEKWIEAVSKILEDDEEIATDDETVDRVDTFVKHKQNNGEVLWSSELGTVLKY